MQYQFSVQLSVCSLRMIDNLFDADVPSERQELLNKLMHRRVTKLIKYIAGEGEPETTVKRLGLTNQDAFALVDGSLYIEFDSEIAVYVGTDDSLNSVCIGLEFENQIKREESLCDDPEFISVSANNQNYANPFFKEYVGKELLGYEIFKQVPPSVRHQNLPNEVALVLKFNGYPDIVLSHGLYHNKSIDFAVLQWEQVDKDVYQTLYKGCEFRKPFKTSLK